MEQNTSIVLLSKRVFLVFAVLFFLLTLFEAVKYSRHRDAVDLGFRITGTRLMADQKSPYLYLWKEGDKLEYYNQYEIYKGGVSGVTVPPSVLILMKPFANLSSISMKWIWMSLTYLFFGLSIFLFFKLSEESIKVLLIAVALLFFGCSLGWLLHVQRGQNYVLYLFLLSLVYYLFKKEKIVLSLLVLTLLIWLRFPFAIFLIPFLSFFKKRNYVLIFVSFIILLIGISLLHSTVQDWNDYFYAVSEWSKAQVLQADFFSNSSALTSKNAEVGAIINEKEFLINNSSLQYLLQYHLNIGLFKGDLFALFLLGGVVIAYPIRKILRRGDSEILFLFAFLLYILFEVCIPAPRYNYTYLQWLFPVLLVLANDKIIIVKPYQWTIAIIGLLLNMGLFIYLPRSLTIGEVFVFTAVWLVLISNKKNKKAY